MNHVLNKIKNKKEMKERKIYCVAKPERVFPGVRE